MPTQHIPPRRRRPSTSLPLACVALASMMPLASFAATWQWDGGAGDGDWQQSDNWNPDAANPNFNGNFSDRLNVNGAQALIYTSAEGTTIYGADAIRGLVVGSGTSGTMTITGGTFSTVDATGANSQDIIGNSNGSTGILNISGGTFIGASTGTALGLGGGTGRVSTLNVNSGTATITSLILNSTNATVNLDGGTLEVNNISRVGNTGDLNLNGGTLRARQDNAAFVTGLSNVNVNSGGAIIDSNGFNITIGNVLKDGGGGGGLTKQGAGNLTLTAVPTYTGDTAISAGTLTYQLGSTYAYSGAISGAGALSVLGTGAVTLNGSNSYLGTTNIGDGTASSVLVVGHNNALGTTAGGTVLKGVNNSTGAILRLAADVTVTGEALTLDGTSTGRATLETIVAGTQTWDGNITVDGNGVVALRSQNTSANLVIGSDATDTLMVNSGARVLLRGGSTGTIHSTITGDGGLSKTDTGTWTIASTNNNYLGSTGIAQGALAFGSIADSGANSSIGKGSTITFSNAAGLTGTLRFTGASGGSSNRAIDIIATHSSGGKAIIENTVAGQTLDLSGDIALIDGTNASTLTVRGEGNTTISGDITSANIALTKADNGTLTLSGTNTYTGITTISGGTLSTGLLADGGTASGIGQAASLAANLVIDGGTLKYTGAAVTINRAFTVGANGAAFDTSSSTGTLWINSTAAFSGSGARTITATTGTGTLRLGTIGDGTGGSTSIVKQGSGQLMLTGSNTYTGQLQILEGQVQYGNAGAGGESTGVGHTVAISSGANLNFRHAGSNVVTYDADISGAGLVQMNYSNTATGGSLTLGGNNTFTGGLTINPNATGGTNVLALKAGSTTALGTGNVTIGQYGKLDINGFSNTTGLLISTGTNGIVTNDGAADATLTLNSSETQTYGGVIQDGAKKVSIIKDGSGTQTLTGTNTYTGDTTVSAGTLALTGTGSIDNSANLVVNGTLDVSGITVSTFTVGAAQTLSGDGTINATGKTLSIAGTHAVGNSPGQQDITGNLNYASASIFEWDLNAGTTDPGENTANSGTYDQVAVTGDLSGTGSTFKIVLGTNAFTDAFWNTHKTWSNIFTAANSFDLGTIFTSFDGTGVDSAGLVAGRGTFTLSGTSLTWTAVPEPTSALAGILLGAGLLRRRRARA